MYLLMVRSDVLQKTCGAKRTAVWWWLIWWWLKRFWKLLVWLVIHLLWACDLDSGYGVMMMLYGVVFCKSVAVASAEWGADWWAVLGFRVDAADWGSGWWAVLGFRVLRAKDAILVIEEIRWWRASKGLMSHSMVYLRQGVAGSLLHPLLHHVSLWSTSLRFIRCWWT